MYQTILVTLDGTETDRAILEHIQSLAKLCQSRLILLHVATGWAACRFGADAISPEIDRSREYLESQKRELQAAGLEVQTHLAYGKPTEQIVDFVNKNAVDLIAMSTHGHRLLGDLLLGTTAAPVSHHVAVPVLLVRGKKPTQP